MHLLTTAAPRDKSLDARMSSEPAIRLSRKDWPSGANGAVLSPIPGAERAQRSCPAGLIAEVGLRWCGDDAALNRTEDLNVEGYEEVHQLHRPRPCGECRDARSAPGEPKIKKTDPGSKQSRVIALLSSPDGTTIAAMMKATGWQQHSVRGFLAGVVRKKLKLKLNSKKIDGTRVYRIDGGHGIGTALPSQSKRRAA